jgi:hypothetical protein
MVKFVIDAVLFPSMFVFMTGIMFAGAVANLGEAKQNGFKQQEKPSQPFWTDAPAPSARWTLPTADECHVTAGASLRMDDRISPNPPFRRGSKPAADFPHQLNQNESSPGSAGVAVEV